MMISSHFPPPVITDSAASLALMTLVLDLGHVLFGRALFRERPRQHEFGLKDRSRGSYHPVEGRPHPTDHRMANWLLDILERLAGVALKPIRRAEGRPRPL
jgi:hypothetical protein